MAAAALVVRRLLRQRIFLPEVAVHALKPDREQGSAGQVAGQLDDPVDEFRGVVDGLDRLAQVVVPGQPVRAVVELHEEHRAVAEAVDLPAPLQGVVQILGDEARERGLAVLEQVDDGVGIGGEVGVVDGVQADPVGVPVEGVLLQPDARSVHPAPDGERAVVEQVVGVRRVASVPRFVERLVDGVVGGEGDQLVEVGNRPLEMHLEGPVVDGEDFERLDGHFAVVDRLGVLEAVEDEGVFRGVGRVEHLAPTEHEVVGGYRLAVAPAGFGTQVEGRRGLADLPALGDPAHQAVVRVVAQQALHGMAEDAEAHLVGAPGRVQLRRLAAQRQRDGSGDGVHRLARAAFVPLRQRPEQQAQSADAEGAQIQQLPERADVEAGSRSTLGDVRTRRFGDVAHILPRCALSPAKPPTTRFATGYRRFGSDA